MTCGQVWWPILWIFALHLTHPSAHTVVNTHIVNTHTEQWAANAVMPRGAVGGSVPDSRVPQSWYWRWRECSLFTRDSNPQPRVTSPTFYPWVLRPRLPHSWVKEEVNFQNKNVLIIYSTPRWLMVWRSKLQFKCSFIGLYMIPAKE